MLRHARTLWLVETRAAEDPWSPEILGQVARHVDAYLDQAWAAVGDFATAPNHTLGGSHAELFRQGVGTGLRMRGALLVVGETAPSTRLLEQCLSDGPLRRWWSERRSLASDRDAWWAWTTCMLADAVHAGAWAGMLLADLARPVPALEDVRQLRQALEARPMLKPLFAARQVFALADRWMGLAPREQRAHEGGREGWVYHRAEMDAPFPLPGLAGEAFLRWATERTIDESLRRGIAQSLEDHVPEIRAQHFLSSEWPELICEGPSPTISNECLHGVWLPVLRRREGSTLLRHVSDEAVDRGYAIGRELARRFRKELQRLGAREPCH